MRPLYPIICCVFLLTTGCLLDWSGDRPDFGAVDAGPPDVAPPDAPPPDLHAGADGPDLFVIVADAFAPPGPWVTISAGSFTMGSPVVEDCRVGPPKFGAETQHEVKLTHDFQINMYEVKLVQWEAIMGYKTPGTSLHLPAYSLSWHEAVSYCNTLSSRRNLTLCYVNMGSENFCSTDQHCLKNESCDIPLQKCARYEAAYSGAKIYDCPGYRLPTEAEWEYAYRAGSTSAYHNGKEPNPAACDKCANIIDKNLDPIAWYCGNSSLLPGGLKPGGLKLSNAWGLYDMAGNLSEWCHDTFVHDLKSAPETDPVKTVANVERVVRGGDYHSYATTARAASRTRHNAVGTSNYIGLRCVRTLPPDAGP